MWNESPLQVRRGCVTLLARYGRAIAFDFCALHNIVAYDEPRKFD